MSDLWNIVSAEAEADNNARLVEAALIATEPYRSIIVQATSAEDFENRFSTVADRFDTAISEVVESSQSIPQVKSAVMARYRAEFRNNERSLKKDAQRKQLLQKQVIAEIRATAYDDDTYVHDNGVVEISESAPDFYTNPNYASCGECQRTWDDSVSTGLTPVPSGRCPFEYEHDFDVIASRKIAGWVEAPVVQAFDVLDAENNYIATVCKDCANRDYFGLITEPTSHDDLEGDPSVGIWPITECSGCGASFLPDIMWEASRKTAANAIYAVDCLDCGWSTSDSDTINTADYKNECPDCGSDDLEFLALSDNGVTLIPTERRLATRKIAMFACMECGKKYKNFPRSGQCSKCHGYDIDLDVTASLTDSPVPNDFTAWITGLDGFLEFFDRDYYGAVNPIGGGEYLVSLECNGIPVIRDTYVNSEYEGRQLIEDSVNQDKTASRHIAEQFDPDTYLDACQDCINDMSLDGILRSKPAPHEMRCEVCGAKVFPGEVMYDLMADDLYNGLEIAAKRSPWGELKMATRLAQGIYSGYTDKREGGIALMGKARRHMERVRPLYAAQGVSMGRALWFDQRTGWALVATLWPKAVSPTKAMPPKSLAKAMPVKVAKRYVKDVESGGVKINATKKTASTGFSCKECGAESPVGIGYKDDGPYPSPDPDCINFHVVDGDVVAGDGGEVPSHMTATKKTAEYEYEGYDVDEGDTCPECGRGYVTYDPEYNDYYCTDCGAEFGEL